MSTMFYFIFFILLLSTSTQFADALACAIRCDFDGHIDNVIFPSCTVVNKSSTEQSCQGRLTIDYESGEIIGGLHPATPPRSFHFDTETAFLLSDEGTRLIIEFDCVTSDNCDQEFLKEILHGNWRATQDQAKNLRNILASILFNSSDLRPNDTCPANQTCKGEGFCQVIYQDWSDTPRPIFQSTCTNPTESPVLTWRQAYDQSKTGQIMLYTCNEPLCGSLSSAEDVIRLLQRSYDLPFNVTIPSITSTTTTSTTSTTPVMTTTSTGSTTRKNIAISIHIAKTEKIVFAFLFLVLFYLF
ncbi:unnamed protein product [Didymodactylos carnosus]|uniref:Uncharacterized protein n=1 Tax=Didymodactylos carnosus TaxID=1234261 RepID=A0A815NFQ5_9BILA|nr:unnamed protein product [Didymodactylos carnosus]CAF4310013.1 unnamed protein product [Didymodactylos carnosus]